jgi:SSS family solute:Na+ symporter/sodium/proline symporter
MSQLYVAVLAVIVVALLAVAIYRTFLVKTKADYLVAGRSLPAVVLVLTLLTSWIGAGSLFAGAENAYRNGFAALWLAAGGWLGLLLIYFIAPRARRFAQFTLPDLLEVRYNQAARVLGTIAILFAYVGITSYQFKGGGNVLHLIFPDSVTPEMGTYLIAAFVILTTALAGMSSVAYMDVAIGSLVTVICVIATPMLFFKAGGWAGLHAALPETHFQVLGNFTLVRAFEFLVPTLLLMLGNQVMYQKFFSARSEKDARLSVVGWILGTVLLETLIVAIAVFGSALYWRSSPPALRDHPLHCPPRAARLDGSSSPRRRLRQSHLHRLELPVLPGFQPGRRRVCALHRARRIQQARPHRLAAGRGPARLLGPLPGHLRPQHSRENALGLHHLWSRAYPGGAGRFLFQTRHGLGRGSRHWRGYSGHARLGCARR